MEAQINRCSKLMAELGLTIAFAESATAELLNMKNNHLLA